MKNIDAILYLSAIIIYSTLLFGGITYGFIDMHHNYYSKK